MFTSQTNIIVSNSKITQPTHSWVSVCIPNLHHHWLIVDYIYLCVFPIYIKGNNTCYILNDHKSSFFNSQLGLMGIHIKGMCNKYLEKWQERWQKCTNSNGEYFEGEPHQQGTGNVLIFSTFSALLTQYFENMRIAFD